VIPRRRKPWKDKTYVEAYKKSPQWERTKELGLGREVSGIKRLFTYGESPQWHIKDDVNRAVEHGFNDYGQYNPDGTLTSIRPQGE
jgi:hypothetical protein